MNDLKPCPFCGGTNLAAGYHSPFIVCEDCGAFGPGSADSTHEEAAEAWNTRTPEQAIAATLGIDTKGCENLLWELVGALDVADATDASKKPIVTEYARRIAATLGEEKAGKKSPLEGGPGPCGQPSDDIIHDAATLGDGKLTAEQVREAIKENSWAETSTILEFNDSSWQAIADELNAMLGGGECELHDCDGSFSALNKPVWRCDCGAFMTQYTDATTYHKPRFCPNCGKAVKR